MTASAGWGFGRVRVRGGSGLLLVPGALPPGPRFAPRSRPFTESARRAAVQWGARAVPRAPGALVPIRVVYGASASPESSRIIAARSRRVPTRRWNASDQ
ncbi:hypothetical protein GCM10018987_66890 [Streptomyces cremeus]